MEALMKVLIYVLLKMTGTMPDIQCCGRTDAGVHAREYVLSFGLELPINCRITNRESSLVKLAF